MPKPLRFKNDSLIYCKGDESDKVFILQSGKVTLVCEDIKTGENIREAVLPGEFFGVTSALGRYPREENAVVLSDTVVAAFTVPEFELFAMSDTRIILKLLKNFSGQMRQIHERISGISKEEEPKPDEGLLEIGEKYQKNERYSHAKYIFSRYLDYYPKGKNVEKAVKNLHIAEIALAQAAQQDKTQKNPSDESNPVKNRNVVPNDDVFAEGVPDPGNDKTLVKTIQMPDVNGGDNAADLDFESFDRFTRTFLPDEIIFSECEPGNAFYLIRSGRVLLLKNAGEHELTLHILQPPEIFGEMAVLENSPRTTTALALNTVKALELDAGNFEILMLGNPALAFKLLRILAKRIFDSKRRYMIFSLPDPQTKVMDVFLMLNETQTNIDKPSELREFRITTEEIARLAGISVSQARETLSFFAGQNRLKVSPNSIAV